MANLKTVRFSSLPTSIKINKAKNRDSLDGMITIIEMFLRQKPGREQYVKAMLLLAFAQWKRDTLPTQKEVAERLYNKQEELFISKNSSLLLD